MAPFTAPILDPRSRQDVIDDCETLATKYVPEWAGKTDPTDPGWQLVLLFGRLMEVLIERMNRVPDKNFLSFLDMVGVEQLPGSAAVAPVTFALANDELIGGEIPAGTQVATTQTETTDAQVFETDTTFYATPAVVQKIVNVVPGQSGFSELVPGDLPPELAQLETDTGWITALSESAALTTFANVLYIRSEKLFGREETVDLALQIRTSGGPPDVFNDANLQWKRYDADAEAWVDQTAVYTPVGADVVSVSFTNFAGSAQTEIDGVAGNWLACHFKGDFATVSIPVITGISGTIAATGGGKGTVDAAFRGTSALDIASPFYPFGDRPKYGDALYLASTSLFGPDVEEVTLAFTISEYSDSDLDAIFTRNATIVTEIDWQYLDEDGLWKDLKSFRHTLAVTGGGTTFSERFERHEPGQPFVQYTSADEDGTLFGNNNGNLATVTLELHRDIGWRTFNGLDAYWIRAIIRSSSPYGTELTIIAATSSTTPPTVVGPTFIPPIIESLSVTATYRSDPIAVDGVLSLHNFEFLDRGGQIAPEGFPLFVAIDFQVVASKPAFFGPDPALYIGFDKPFGAVFIGIYFHLLDVLSAPGYPGESGDPRIVWEYVNDEHEWKPLDVSDGSVDLTSSGLVTFLGPDEDDSGSIELFQHMTDGAESPGALYWYRARLSSGEYDHPPVIRGVYLNTMTCRNIVTRTDDLVLASGNGTRPQTMTVVGVPVIGGDVWVKESEAPSLDELDQLARDYADYTDDIDLEPDLDASDFLHTVEPESETGDRQNWVRWVKVPTFLVSKSASRHYTLDRITGVLTFGDGINGALLPIGTDNIVMRGHKTGGGEAANTAASALAVKELKSSLPFVDKVFNVTQAVGGSDSWSLDKTKEFGPQVIKNRGRAVTTEDYEWMTLQKFSSVARARCLATTAPQDDGTLTARPGAVTMLVVPKSQDRLPQPSKGLLREIEQYLRGETLGNIVQDIYAIGPQYIEIAVQVRAHATVIGESSSVGRRIVAALETFFHPLSGGEYGTGWIFGRDVYISEIYATVERVAGVSFVESVKFLNQPATTVIAIEPNHLVASGIHDVQMV